jgi:hypothetical protein
MDRDTRSCPYDDVKERISQEWHTTGKGRAKIGKYKK